jgi:hypothetical protein
MTKILFNSILSFVLFIFGFVLIISSVSTFAQNNTNQDNATTQPATEVLPSQDGGTTPQAGTAGATTNNGTSNLTYLNLTSYECFFEQSNCGRAIYPDIVKFLKDISLPLTTLFIIFGGFEWINDKDVKRTTAQATIFGAIGGYIVINLSDKIADVIRLSIDRDKGFNPVAINALLDNLIDFGLNIATVVCVACLVLAGYSYYVEYFWNEGRQSDKLQPTNLVYGAISGLIVITLARPIIFFVKSIFNADGGNLVFQNQPIVTLIQNILVRFAIPVSSIGAVAFLVVAGYYWMTAQGDEKKVATAQTMVKNAVIGFVIILLCSTIVQLITFFIQPAQGFLPPSDPNPSQVSPNTNPAPLPGENTGTPTTEI